jgi:hypothetical protein
MSCCFKVFSIFTLKLTHQASNATTASRRRRCLAQFSAACYSKLAPQQKKLKATETKKKSKKSPAAAKDTAQQELTISKSSLRAINLLNKLINQVIETTSKTRRLNEDTSTITAQVKSRLLLANKSNGSESTAAVIAKKEPAKKVTKRTTSPKKEPASVPATYPLLTEYEHEKLDFKFGKLFSFLIIFELSVFE